MAASGLSTFDALRAQTLGMASPGTVAEGTSGADHGSLTGLADDDHSQYVHKDTARTIAAQHTFSPATTQAPFALSANAQGQTVTGLKADQLNKTITAGTGLTGGGALTGNVTLNVGAGTGITANADDVAVNLSYAFTWAALHTFNAGARIAAGQDLQFGSDVAIKRKAADILQLATGDVLQSSGYASGITGWSINDAGDAEFNNVNVRGELRASVFKVSEITATAGTFGVWKSAAALAEAYTTPGSVGSSNTLKAKNSDAGGSLLAANDIIRIKTWTGSGVGDAWMTVTAVGTNSGTYTSYTVRLESGSTNTTFPAGGAVADYGPSGSGYITLSADGTIGSSANLSIATHAGSPWSTQTLHVRLGNLNGSYGLVSNLYGIGLGDYSAGNYLKYDTSNGFTIKAGGGNILLDGDGISLEGQDGVSSSYLNYKESGWTLGYLRGYVVGSSPNRAGYMYLSAEYQGTGASHMELSARGAVLSLNGSSTAPWFNLGGGDVRIPNGGLRVGSNSSAAADGEIWTTGSVLVGDTANADATLGLTINQGAADDQILAFKSSDVAHGMTSIAENDTFGFVKKLSATAGGLYIYGLKEDTGATQANGALVLQGALGEAALTTKSTAGFGVIRMLANVKSGTSTTSVGADGNLLSIENYGSVKVIFDAEGDSHQDGTGWTNYDEHDDTELLDLVSAAVSKKDDPLHHKYGGSKPENRKRLQDLRLVTFNDDGTHFINWSRMHMLQVGAQRKAGHMTQELTGQVQVLTAQVQDLAQIIQRAQAAGLLPA